MELLITSEGQSRCVYDELLDLRDWTSPRFVGAGNGLQGFGELGW